MVIDTSDSSDSSTNVGLCSQLWYIHIYIFLLALYPVVSNGGFAGPYYACLKTNIFC